MTEKNTCSWGPKDPKPTPRFGDWGLVVAIVAIAW